MQLVQGEGVPRWIGYDTADQLLRGLRRAGLTVARMKAGYDRLAEGITAVVDA